MSVVRIDSKKRFKFNRPRALNKVLEGLIPYTEFVMAFWLPALLYCIFNQEPWPFALTVLTQALGVLWGVFMYRKQSGDYLSCLPYTHKPNVPQRVSVHEMKKAA